MIPERIPPRPATEWPDEVWDALALIGIARPPAEALEGFRSNLLGLYAWNPGFVAGWMPMSRHFKNSTLPARVRELVVLRTTWLTHGEYEWAQHRRLAGNAGLTDAEIAAVETGPGHPEWSADDVVLLRAIDALVRDRRLSDELWAQLAEVFDRPQLIDLVFMVGTYESHSLAFAALGLQLEPGVEGFPAEHAATAPGATEAARG